MEKCEACGRMISIDSRSEQKRFEAFKEKTNYEFCSSCRKRYENEEVQNAVLNAMANVFSRAGYPFFGRG